MELLHVLLLRVVNGSIIELRYVFKLELTMSWQLNLGMKLNENWPYVDSWTLGWSPMKIDNRPIYEILAESQWELMIGLGGIFTFTLYYLSLYKFIVSLPTAIWVFRILEYSSISLLNLFQDTLAYVGFPAAWIRCDSDGVTKIENKIRAVRVKSYQKSWFGLNQKNWAELNRKWRSAQKFWCQWWCLCWRKAALSGGFTM